MSAEVEDGIADDLSGAVEGDVATAAAFEAFDAAACQEFGGCYDVGGFGVPSQRDDRLMF